MPLASDKVVETVRSLIFCGVLQPLSVATVVCFANSGSAWTQEAIIIGSGLPTIEVNEEATYYGLSQTRIAAQRLPLFDPNKDVLESRILTLPLPGSMDLEAAPSSEGSEAQKPVEKSPVIEEIVREVDVTSSVSSKPAPKVEDPRPQGNSSEEGHPQKSDEIDSSPPKTPETELAAIPPTQQPAPQEETTDSTIAVMNDTSTIIFGKGEKEIQTGQRDKLSALVNSMTRDEKVRLQLKSYASDLNGSPSGARRLSLARALAIRSFLIEAGVNSTRIDVRALGSKNESGPADRVDLVVAN